MLPTNTLFSLLACLAGLTNSAALVARQSKDICSESPMSVDLLNFERKQQSKVLRATFAVPGGAKSIECNVPSPTEGNPERGDNGASIYHCDDATKFTIFPGEHQMNIELKTKCNNVDLIYQAGNVRLLEQTDPASTETTVTLRDGQVAVMNKKPEATL